MIATGAQKLSSLKVNKLKKKTRQTVQLNKISWKGGGWGSEKADILLLSKELTNVATIP